jgi:hypothetical protein
MNRVSKFSYFCETFLGFLSVQFLNFHDEIKIMGKNNTKTGTIYNKIHHFLVFHSQKRCFVVNIEV